MSSPDVAAVPATGARVRTRRAILDAAAGQLAKDAASSLSQIAKAAGVGRTTLHRYYPDRASLLTALADDAREKLTAAHANAKLDEGTALEALERLCQEYIGLLDYLALFFTETLTDDPFSTIDSPNAIEVKNLLKRGYKDGTIDPALSPEWLLTTLWALFYTLWETTLLTGVLSMYDGETQLRLTMQKLVMPPSTPRQITDNKTRRARNRATTAKTEDK